MPFFIFMDIEKLYTAYLNSSKVCTDTRKISKGVIFFCIKGPKYDGNKFALEAFNSGAKYIVVDNPKYFVKNSKFFLVNNSISTIQDLAIYHRSKIKTKIIAITGSNGKTTTKELLLSVLSIKYDTTATKGNLNNHIGVPLTILNFKNTTEFGIVEMGANHLGEINLLCKIADPNFGYITNFGKAHLEGFGSFDSIIKGKSELYEYIIRKNGTIFINGDDKHQIKYQKKSNSYTFSKEGSSDLKISQIDFKNKFINAYFKKTEIKSNLIGDYNFSNISSAIAIGTFFNLNIDEISIGIKKYLPLNNRSQWINKGSNTILMDAYNANPSSMRFSLVSFMKNTNSKKRVIILGDMLELGAYSKKEHQNLIDFISDFEIEKLILIGENFFNSKIKIKNIYKFKTIIEASEFIKKIKFNNTNIFLKGSRGLALENILKFIN
ncbi:MAG: UDP-N-acetylmuramoyl-tripeptide--D-alanyl-D-alanine ligase [Flavobacteriaceae bacterium]|nr:UDP-N-acetylmuramoyl-tripeptide--D-alanyl-D-alanine ligase [Flavobacteriaceae bacterium]